MDSIDKTNVKRLNKVFKKLMKLEELHVKNIQHSLHHIAMLRDEVATVNARINHVFQRLTDLEKSAPSEWLEWSVPKYEVPFEEGVYLRSPGYEVGSMIWCLELRWEMDDETIQDMEHDADILDHDGGPNNNPGANPIVDLRENEDEDTDSTESVGSQFHNQRGGEEDRIHRGYRRLGVYVSPRSVANWERLSSLKATCEIRMNENDYSDAMNAGNQGTNVMDELTPPDMARKKQQHFSVSGDFLRGKKLTSWGRTIPNGDMLFDGTKDDDEVSIKLRIVNQTLSYSQFADDQQDGKITAHISQPTQRDLQSEMKELENFKIGDKGSGMIREQQRIEREQEIEDQVQRYMEMPMREFWNVFSENVESGKARAGVSIGAIVKACKLDVGLVTAFRKGPITGEDTENANIEDEGVENLNKRQKGRRQGKLLRRKIGDSKKWDVVIQHDVENPQFRRKLATFLVKHQHRQRRNFKSKTNF